MLKQRHFDALKASLRISENSHYIECTIEKNLGGVWCVKRSSMVTKELTKTSRFRFMVTNDHFWRQSIGSITPESANTCGGELKDNYFLRNIQR